MTLLRLALGSLANRWYSVLLTVLTIAISIALLLLVDRLRSEVHQGFHRTVSGIDLIVGARTSPVQLLLYSVYGIGDATNNVSWETFREFESTRQVDWAVPLALGDSHEGFRVKGTTEAFFERYRYSVGRELTFADGGPFDDLFDVVVGHQVARQQDYSLGDELVIAHGTGSTRLQQTHDDHPFRISGVLEPTGTPVDHMLYISLEAHRAIHVGWESGAPRLGSVLDPDEAREKSLESESVTAIYVGLTSRTAAFQLQQAVNEYPQEALTAILPGVALQQLWRLTGVAEQALLVISAIVVVAGLLGMLTVLLSTMNERRREMAILRAVGARPWQISFLLLLEAGVVTLAGIIVGTAGAVGLQAFSAPVLLDHIGLMIRVSLPGLRELAILGVILAAGVAIALVPAAMAYRRTLADGMQVRN